MLDWLSVRSALAPLAASLLVAGAGCSSSASPSGADGSGAGAGGSEATATSSSGEGGGATTSTTTTGAGGGATEYTAFESAFAPLVVEPGDEATECITVRLGNADSGYVRRFRATLGSGSHHLIAYLSDATEEKLTPHPCAGFSGLFGGDYPIFIAQQAAMELELPTDAESGLPVGFPIAANQMLRLELHYINTNPTPLPIDARIHLDTVPMGSPIVESAFAFYGTADIDLPPNTTGDTGVHFQEALGGTKTFALTTHQHQLGTRMRVWHSTDASDLSTLVADSTDWADPPLEVFDPPLEFPEGAAKGLAFQCEWANTTASPVGFGEGFNDEMCFLWHYYYPSKGFQLCLDGVCTPPH
jgi:hypothetical protein